MAKARLDEPKRARDARFWIAIAILLASTAIFAIIAVAVATNDPRLQQDLQVSVWLHMHPSPVFIAFLLAITQVHSTAGMAVLTLVVGLALWREGNRHWLLSLALAVPGGLLLNVILKHFFHRERPAWDDPLLTLASSSFPSGHASGATLLYGFLAAHMMWRMKSVAADALAWTGCALMVALVAFSRVYLGVHYLSDVLGAIAISTAWLVLCLITVRAIAHRRRAAAALMVSK